MSIDWHGNVVAVLAWGRRTSEATVAWAREIDRRVLAALATFAAAVIALMVWVLVTDQSRVLGPQEVAAVRSWALATQAPSVAEAFNTLSADGQFTVQEAQDLMEVAKAADPPPGLYQPL